MSDFPPSATTESEPMWGISYEADFTEGTWTFKMVGHDWEVSAGSYAIIYNDEYQDLLKRANGTASEKRVAWQDCTRCGAAILNEYPNAPEAALTKGSPSHSEDMPRPGASSETASAAPQESRTSEKANGSPAVAAPFADTLDVMSGRVPSAAATTATPRTDAFYDALPRNDIHRNIGRLVGFARLLEQELSAPSSEAVATLEQKLAEANATLLREREFWRDVEERRRASALTEGVAPAARVATPAENMEVLYARLNEHMSPAEQRELQEVIGILKSAPVAPEVIELRSAALGMLQSWNKSEREGINVAEMAKVRQRVDAAIRATGTRSANERNHDKLVMLVRWMVRHEGECIGDHPDVLAQAKLALNPPDSTPRHE